MAGSITQQQHILISGSTESEFNRCLFYRISTFLDSKYQRIASYYGITPVAASLSGSGEKAFAVWNTISGSEQFNIFLGWSYITPTSTLIGSEPVWAVGTTDFGVHLSIAWHSSSQAWVGTTNNNGADTFAGSSFFKSGSIIFPRINTNTGTAFTARNNAAGFFDGTTTSGRLYSAGDNDGFCLILSGAGSAGFNYQAVFERYIPFTTTNDFPYVFYVGNTDAGLSPSGFPVNTILTTYGSGLTTDKTSSFIQTNNGSSYGYSYGFDYPTIPTSTNFQAYNRGGGQANAAAVDEFPIILLKGAANKNPVGFLNLIRTTMQSVPDRARIASGSRFAMKDSNTAVKFTMPFTASVNPGGTLFTGSVIFNTSSLAGNLPYVLDNHTFSLITASSTTITSSTALWRYFSGGQYIYTSTFPVGQLDIVKIK